MENKSKKFIFNSSFLIHKYLKFFIEITFDSVTNTFNVSPKLTMLLNQYGLYELDKFNIFLTKYFDSIKK